MNSENGRGRAFRFLCNDNKKDREKFYETVQMDMETGRF